jgi:hypothetical protein
MFSGITHPYYAIPTKAGQEVKLSALSSKAEGITQAFGNISTKNIFSDIL